VTGTVRERPSKALGPFTSPVQGSREVIDMIERYILVLLAILCVAATVSGQQSGTETAHVLAILPPDQGILVVIQQADCPLTFEYPKLLINMKGVWVKSFRLRNRGTKPIRAFTVAAAGTNEWGWEASGPAHYVMPGQIAPSMGDGNNTIVPLTKELREKLKLQGPMKGIVALVVVRVEYTDGSMFEEKAYDSQKEYFENLYEIMSNAKGGRTPAPQATRSGY
jgi:hypothetical protein